MVKTLIKLKLKMQKHNEKDSENAVNNVTANLVVDFLKDHGHVAIASELLKLGSKTCSFKFAWIEVG
jgi:hypothetical protein